MKCCQYTSGAHQHHTGPLAGRLSFGAGPACCKQHLLDSSGTLPLSTHLRSRPVQAFGCWRLAHQPGGQPHWLPCVTGLVPITWALAASPPPTPFIVPAANGCDRARRRRTGCVGTYMLPCSHGTVLAIWSWQGIPALRYYWCPTLVAVHEPIAQQRGRTGCVGTCSNSTTRPPLSPVARCRPSQSNSTAEMMSAARCSGVISRTGGAVAHLI